MQIVALMMIALASTGATEYSRSLAAKKLDQATLDQEGFGEKKAFKREDDGLRVTLAPGDKETGWKTPQAMRFGGDFTITANLVIKKLPKPAQEDGAAIGLALAFQNIDQPDATLVRLVEPSGAEVYRSIEGAANNPMMMQQQQMQQQRMMMMGMMPQPNAKPVKPPRHTFPAQGETVRLEIERAGSTVRYQIVDGAGDLPRYVGQVTVQPNDVAAVKLFVSNRNGAEAINVLLRDITIRAERITGLGTAVRTVFGEMVYADPTAIEKGVLVVGGPPKAPPSTPDPKNAGGAAKPGAAATPKAAELGKPATTKDAAEKPVPAPGPAPAPKETEPPKDAAKPAPAAASVAAPAVPAGAVALDAPPPPAGAAMTAVPQELSGLFQGLPPGAAPQVAPTAPGAKAEPAKPAEPKAKIPLDEVESIRFERAPAPAGRFLGQPNLDFTMPGRSAKKDEPAAKGEAKKTDAGDDVLAPPPGTAVAEKIAAVEAKKNGIRDLHIWLFNLRDAAIKQVNVTCQTDKGPTAWRLDTVDSQDWPLVIHRSGKETSADLFLEPPPADCFQKDFMINLTYEDGQAANIQVKAGEHSDPQKAIDAKAPAIEPLDAWVYLADEDRFFGKLVSLSEETLQLATPWNDRVNIPLSRIAGVRLGVPDRKESAESFVRRLKARGTEDVLLAHTKDGEVVAISGVAEGTEDDELKFRYQEKSRTLPLTLVEGLILAARPEAKAPEELLPTFVMLGPLVISGRWKDIDTATWKVQTSWGQTLNLPANEVQAARFRGGKLTYLSDLNPTKVEETPYFGHRLAWQRDKGLTGEPLKMDGKPYEHGIAVHSRSILTFDLNGRYSTFETQLGFDDSAQGKGRVECRVFADGKELYANPDLRADAPPVKLALSVAGAEQLRLVVDFGKGQDTGDRVIWGNPRLFRKATVNTAELGGSAKP